MNSPDEPTNIVSEKQIQSNEPFLPANLFQSLFWKPRFLLDTPLTEHLPLLFWLTSAICPKQVDIIGANDGVAHFGFCQALDQLGIRGRCNGYGFWLNPKTGDRASRPPSRLIEHEAMLYESSSQLVSCDADIEIFNNVESVAPEIIFCDLTFLPENSRISFDELDAHLSESGILIINGLKCPGNTGGRTSQILRFLNSRRHIKLLSGDGMAIVSGANELPVSLQALFDAAPYSLLRADIEQVFRRCGLGLRASASARALSDAQKRSDRTVLETQERLKIATKEIEDLRASHQERSSKLLELQSENFEIRAELEAAYKAQSEATAVLASAQADAATAAVEHAEELNKLRMSEVRSEAARASALDKASALNRVRLEEVEALTRIAEDLREEKEKLNASLSKSVKDRRMSDTAYAELKTERIIRFKETEILTRMLQDNRARFRHLEASNIKLQHNIERLKESTSWRITAPMRAIKKSFSGK